MKIYKMGNINFKIGKCNYEKKKIKNILKLKMF